jgi:aldehyde dehydrogenase (NAD+)
VVIPHDGDDDAVRIANDSPYGLSGAVWGSDLERVEKVVSGIRTGTLGVNGGIWYGADVPFGGYKQSGIGREMGRQGFEEYLETKAWPPRPDPAHQHHPPHHRERADTQTWDVLRARPRS